MLSVFGAIITSTLSYEDSYSKPPDTHGSIPDFNLANLDTSGGGGGSHYPDSSSGGGPYPDSSSAAGPYPDSSSGGGGGYDYTPHHEEHHHPEPPKGHWEKKMKWKEEWVKEIKTVKKQSHETKWKSVSVPVWQDVEGELKICFANVNSCTMIECHMI